MGLGSTWYAGSIDHRDLMMKRKRRKERVKRVDGEVAKTVKSIALNTCSLFRLARFSPIPQFSTGFPPCNISSPFLTFPFMKPIVNVRMVKSVVMAGNNGCCVGYTTTDAIQVFLKYNGSECIRQFIQVRP